jgi:hypothetical protein
MDYSFIYRFIVIICSHSWGSGGLWPWQKACKDLQTKVGISALVFGFTTLKGLEMNMAPSTFEIIGDEHWWFLKNLYLVLMWIDNIYQKNKKMEPDENWWNLMKSDEIWWKPRFHQISSVFIRLQFSSFNPNHFDMKSDEIWWNLMKTKISSDFISFHHFSSVFIRLQFSSFNPNHFDFRRIQKFSPSELVQLQPLSIWLQCGSKVFTRLIYMICFQILPLGWFTTTWFDLFG